VEKNTLVVPFTKYYYGHEVKGDETDAACRMHAGDEKFTQNFNWNTLMEDNTWETQI
jgi:hypothetical protein